MIKKRLVQSVPESKPFIMKNVLFQCLSLFANIATMLLIASALSALYHKTLKLEMAILMFVSLLVLLALRFFFTLRAGKMGFLASKDVKRKLRSLIYQKLCSLGASYKNQINSSEIVQLAVEGVDQLEVYFSAYLPQFFYSMIAPLTLFIVISFLNFKAAIILFLCVPLIPLSIAAVQTFAKKLLKKYWGQYSSLGNSFLENLQGLTTLKVFQADEKMHQKMNEEAERFRKVTMRVLFMQLNSISIMDLVAFGGAALGMIIAVSELLAGNISLASCIFIILISADFFLPLRALGSLFHIAMNGMAASDKIFALLDISETQKKESIPLSLTNDLSIQNVSFRYTEDKEVLKNINAHIAEGSFFAIVGESGCGKSTLAKALCLQNKSYEGDILLGGVSLKQADEKEALQRICYLSHNSYLFKGSVRENLLFSNEKADDAALLSVLKKVQLWGFLSENGGLDCTLQEAASNLSGGQRQRLAFARALLADSPIYIFDEASSNIDMESENAIMALIHDMAKSKTIILISHRLSNVVNADRILVLKDGMLIESGTHEELMRLGAYYHTLFSKQSELEKYLGREEA